MKPIIMSLRNISKAYKEKGKEIKVLDSISLDIYEDFTAIIGPSGSGKSTLLRIIAGVEKYDSGEIIYHEKVKI
ncbi:MAG: ATP-binding cassette domain-containing protein, partial [Desulfurococcaceae archaeon]